MKFSKEDYEELSNTIDSFIKEVGISAVKEHRNKKLGNDTERRFRWDLLWGSRYIVPYGRYNDSHIDSALKKYVASRPDLIV